MSPQLRGGAFASPDKRQLLGTLAGLMETGQVRVVVDSTFPLAQVPEAMRHLMSGKPLGRVVVRID
ncbi:MAG: zinc-binding dehydrogenase [Actinobacteria bacterium]|nr:zinc-binding dehydrogenase [Actinomycetota bacterium]